MPAAPYCRDNQPSGDLSGRRFMTVHRVSIALQLLCDLVLSMIALAAIAFFYG